MTQIITLDDIVRTSKIPYDRSRTRSQNNNIVRTSKHHTTVQENDTKTTRGRKQVDDKRSNPQKRDQENPKQDPTLDCPQVFLAEVHPSKTPLPVEVHLC